MADETPLIPVSRPLLGRPEAEAVERVLRSGWVGQGSEVAAFEAEFAARVGAAHACAVSSGSAALHLALLVAGVRHGDEVTTVSHSFIATANSVRHCGAVPVFVDVRPGTGNMDPELVERAIGPRTRALLCVHQLGMPCELPSLVSIARRHALPVIEDAACALGSRILREGSWEPIGRPHGDIACFSFHPRKAITTGEGGMLTTSNASWDARLRVLRHQGRLVSAAGIPEGPGAGLYRELGYNYRMTDLQAAIGRAQLTRLDGILAHRRAQVERYRALLAGVPGLTLPEEPAWARSNWQSYCICLPAGRDQGRVMAAMRGAGVDTRPGVTCAHREPVYRSEPWSCGAGPGACGCVPGACARLPESEAWQARGLVLPLFDQMTEAQQDRVAAALAAACAEGAPSGSGDNL